MVKHSPEILASKEEASTTTTTMRNMQSYSLISDLLQVLSLKKTELFILNSNGFSVGGVGAGGGGGDDF